MARFDFKKVAPSKYLQAQHHQAQFSNMKLCKHLGDSRSEQKVSKKLKPAFKTHPFPQRLLKSLQALW